MKNLYTFEELLLEIKTTPSTNTFATNLHLTFYQTNDDTAFLVCVVGYEGLSVLRNKTIKIWEFNLNEDNPHDYIKQAQNLKARLKRHFDSRTIASDFRW